MMTRRDLIQLFLILLGVWLIYLLSTLRFDIRTTHNLSSSGISLSLNIAVYRPWIWRKEDRGVDILSWPIPVTLLSKPLCRMFQQGNQPVSRRTINPKYAGKQVWPENYANTWHVRIGCWAQLTYWWWRCPMSERKGLRSERMREISNPCRGYRESSTVTMIM